MAKQFVEDAAVQELLYQPLQQQAVTMNTSEIIRPQFDDRVQVPIIRTIDPNRESGWISKGGEAPLTGLEPEPVTLDTHTIAVRATVPWISSNKAEFDMSSFRGDAMVRDLVDQIDRANFASASTAPMGGIARTEGINTIAVKDLTDVAWALEAQENAVDHGATINSFVVNAQTYTRIANIKRGAGSNETLLNNDATQPWQSLINGVPVRVSRHVDPNTVWAIPHDRVIFAIRQDMTIVSDDTAEFNTLAGSIMAYANVGLVVSQPAALSKITLPAAA